MKISKKTILQCAGLTLLVGLLPIVKVAADTSTLTSEQVKTVKTNCLSAKNTLDQLHASDALLRVNMGQMYESLETKLMVGFDGRVSNNKLDNSKLKVITNTYSATLDGFRADYIAYENQLSAATSIDCIKQPAAFYDAVGKAREGRSQVHNDVVKLNQLIDQYQAALNDFQAAYASKGSK